jgi:trimethylamine--corrinoid protein Co-methyltransferase
MRKGFMRLGRPEGTLLHMSFGQLAKKRKALFHANCFLSDAHRPSVETGYQKAITAIPAFLSGSISTGGIGMLSIDEYNSPIQLILDNEFSGAMKRMLRGFEISEETLAMDLIHRVGTGGNYLNEEHTFEHYRNELWMPSIWTGVINSGWESGGRKLDVDYAREVYEDVIANYHPRGISEKTEEELMRIIQRAEKEIYNP